MKYNRFLLLLLPVICSCSQNKTMNKLTQTDSLLDRLETDSVKKMLCGIDTLIIEIIPTVTPVTSRIIPIAMLPAPLFLITRYAFSKTPGLLILLHISHNMHRSLLLIHHRSLLFRHIPCCKGTLQHLPL